MLHTESATGVSPGASSADTVPTVRVPLLGELLKARSALERTVWVDFGQAQDGLLRRLAHRRVRLLVVDMGNALRNARKDWYRPDSIFPAHMWTEPGDHFLCWDLLNYMTPEQLGRFSGQLVHRAGTGARVHALIQYSARQMPSLPQHFRLGHIDELQLGTTSTEAVDAPRYSPKALEKSMPGLAVERTMLLNNGMQEFVFLVRDEA